MTDDLDEMLLGEAIARGFMPTLKSTFVDAGTRLANSFVSNSECCPSRVTFLTGQYTHNHKVFTNGAQYSFAAFDDSVSLATWLRDAGYYTGFVGKYLNGYWGRKDLDGDGVIDPGPERRYVPPGWDVWQGLLDPTTYRVLEYYVLNGLTETAEYYPDRYQTEVLKDKAVEFIELAEQRDGDPFFLWVSTLAPHAEDLDHTIKCFWETGGNSVKIRTIRPAPEYAGSANGMILPKSGNFNEQDISDKPDWHQYFADRPLDASAIACIQEVFQDKLESLRSVDDLIAGILQALEDHQETNETLLLFTSDNGFVYGNYRLLEPAKTLAFEESIRVPLYVRDLSTPEHRTVIQPALNNDLAPTFLEIAGHPVPTSVDGRSLLPVLGDTPPATWRKRFLVEHWFNNKIPTYAALRTFGDKPVTYVEYKASFGSGGGWDGCAPGRCELYFLARDRFQANSQHASTQAQGMIPSLSRFLTALRGCRNGTCQLIEDQ